MDTAMTTVSASVDDIDAADLEATKAAWYQNAIDNGTLEAIYQIACELGWDAVHEGRVKTVLHIGQRNSAGYLTHTLSVAIGDNAGGYNVHRRAFDDDLTLVVKYGASGSLEWYKNRKVIGAHRLNGEWQPGGLFVPLPELDLVLCELPRVIRLREIRRTAAESTRKAELLEELWMV